MCFVLSKSNGAYISLSFQASSVRTTKVNKLAAVIFLPILGKLETSDNSCLLVNLSLFTWLPLWLCFLSRSFGISSTRYLCCTWLVTMNLLSDSSPASESYQLCIYTKTIIRNIGFSQFSYKPCQIYLKTEDLTAYFGCLIGKQNFPGF